MLKAGAAKKSQRSLKSQLERLHLVWDFQNGHQHFPSSNIKEVTGLSLLTVGPQKTVEMVWISHAESLRLVCNFQNSLQHFSSSNIKEVTDLALLTAGAAENGRNRLNFTLRKSTFGLGFPKRSNIFLAQILRKFQIRHL